MLLSNIYAATDKRDLSANVEQWRRERSVEKLPGCTWIEVNEEVHTFVVDDQDHLQITEIHAELQRLSGQMHDAGYVQDTRFVLHDVDEEEKLFHLCHHSKKLAIWSYQHLLVLHYIYTIICGYVMTATLSPSSLQR